MTNAFHNEIPKSRINLSIDVNVDGKTKTVALPHKTLVLGNFSAGHNQLPVQEREKKNVTRDNIDSVMKDVSPTLDLSLPNRISKNSNELNAKLKFSSLKDFHPESIALQVPEMKRLLAMRHLLKDLRAHMSDNQALKELLKNVMQSSQNLKMFQEEVARLVNDHQGE